MANRRYIDFPIASTSSDTDIILIWQDGLNKQTTKATLLSGLPEDLADLNDVVISGLTNGQILRYNSTTSVWENTNQGNLDLNDLNDVTIVSPSNGQVLVYNSSTSQWENSSGGYVPYVGAVTTVDLGAQGLRAGYVRFDTTVASVPDEQGLMYWDGSRSTVALIMNGTLQHIGQDSFFYVKNSTGSSINKGVAVRFDGTDGASGHLKIAPFLADGTYPSTYFMGVTADTIGNGEFGQVMHFGELEGINTSGFTAGDLLYASTTVAGGFQTTAPVAPNNIVLIGAAVNSKNNGAIVVRPTYGSNINNDEGVKLTSVADKNLLQYQSGTGLWENKTLGQVLGGTSSQFVKGDGSLDSTSYQPLLTNPVTGTGTTNYLPKFTGASTIGNSNLINDSSGNLGLGVTPSAWNSAYKAMQFGTTGAIFGESGDAANYFTTNTFVDSVGFKYITSDWALGYFQENGVHSWRNAPSGTAGNAISFTQAMTLDSSGRFGVGTGSSSLNNHITFTQTIGGSPANLSELEPYATLKIKGRPDRNNIVYIGALDALTGMIIQSGTTSTAAPLAIQPFGGNLLVGTTTDNGARLQVSGTATFSSSVTAGSLISALATFSNFGSPTAAVVAFADGNTGFFRPALNTLGITTAGSERLRITSSGNVLIGTTTDNGARLQVSGAATFSSSVTAGDNITTSKSQATSTNISVTNTSTANGAYAQISVINSALSQIDMVAFGSGSTGTLYGITKAKLKVIRDNSLTAQSNGLAIGTDAAVPFYVFTNSTERLRITSSGELLVNTTTNSATSGVGSKFVSNGRLFTVSFYSDNTQESLSMYSTGAANYRFYVGWGGTIYATSTSISGISDISLKTNIRDLDKGLQDILQLKPRRFDWKNGDGKDNIGFVAQEIESIFPELISEYKYNQFETKKSLKMGDLIPSLVKAIQELKQEIDTLKN